MTTSLALNQRQLAVDYQQHAVELVAAAQDQSARRNHAVNALLAYEPRIFFDTIDRHFRGAAEHREHGAVPQEIDAIIPPPAVGHRPPSCIATRKVCVGPVLSVPDSSAPSPPGSSGSGRFAGSLSPYWANASWSFFFWDCRFFRVAGATCRNQ